MFASYCSAKGHAFMGRRLFLPEEGAGGAARREKAGVPAGVAFRTKPELAPEVLGGAIAEGVPMRWVGGDSVYGNSPTFVRGVRQLASGTSSTPPLRRGYGPRSPA